jgi:Ca2+-binding RTX toxin-like protein
MEGLAGGAGNDSLLGDVGNNILQGGGGDDTLNGAAGQDTLTFDDLWNGTPASGTNWFDPTNRTTSAVTVDLAAGTSSGAAGNDSFTGIEAIIGGMGDDSLFGDSQDNYIEGTLGLNTLSGDAGNDTLVGPRSGLPVGDWCRRARQKMFPLLCPSAV